MDPTENVTNEAAGNPLSTKSQVLQTGASVAQLISSKALVLTHLTSDVRQCLIYDTPLRNARLIGVEYMISGSLYRTLPPEERKLWHSHVLEVKSGMLIMPGPNGLPTDAWEVAETKEMEDIVGLYGKTYHFWQVDRGDKLPLGEPQLMMSLTREDQCPPPGFDKVVGERDQRFGVDHKQKAKKRDYIPEPAIHEDADSMWKKGSSSG
ncbi:MAG: hypothetical protein Q9217_006972 [Psora testacea]